MKKFFKLTNAENFKLLKNPSFYVMGILLVIAVVFSLILYSPSNGGRQEYQLNTESVIVEYEKFNNETKSIFDEQINNSKNLLNFYNEYNIRINNINNTYKNINSAINILKTSSDFTLITEAKNTYITEISNLYNYYSNFSNIDSCTTINLIKNNDYYLENYLNVPTDTLKCYKSLENYKNSISSFSVTTIVSDYNNNRRDIIINNAYNASLNFVNTTINNTIDAIKIYNTQLDTLITAPNANLKIGQINIEYGKLKDALNNLSEIYNTIISNTKPIALITIETKNNLNDIINVVINTTLSKMSVTYNDVQNLPTILRNSDYINKFIAIKNQTDMIEISDLSTAINFINTATTNNTNNILTSLNKAKDDNNFKGLSQSITKYYNLAMATENYVNNYIKYNILNNTEINNNQISLMSYNGYNKYQTNDQISLNKYYLENNVYANSFANNFSFEKTSNGEANCYDFMYYSMGITSILIIVFMLIICCNTIASESNSGTIKLLLIRPYSRGKIINAKLLSALSMAILFVLFSAIISFIGGVALFGISNTPILTIFNSTNAFVISPILAMIIYLFTIIIKIYFYILLAFALSCLINNFAGAVSTGIVIYLASLAGNMFIENSIFYSFLHPFNIDWYKYLGSGFIGSNSIISKIISTPITSNMSFWFSLIVFSIYTLLLYLLTIIKFKKKDF